MKNTLRTKIIIIFSIVSAVPNVYSFDKLTQLNARAHALRTLGSDKNIQENVKRIEKEKEELLGGLSKIVSNIIKLTQSNKLLNERNKVPALKNSTDIAYKLVINFSEDRKKEEIIFAAQKIEQSIKKYDHIDKGLFIAHTFISSSALIIKNKDLDQNKVNIINREFNIFFGLDAQGISMENEKNYGECLGLSATDMKRYKESTDRIMAEYEKHIQNLSGLTLDERTSKTIPHSKYIFADSNGNRISVVFDPIQTDKLDVNLISNFDYEYIQEVFDFNTNEKDELALNKEVNKMLRDFGLISNDIDEDSPEYRASKEDSTNIRNLISTLFLNSIDQYKNRNNEIIARPFVQKMIEFENKFKVHSGCYINEELRGV